MSDHYILNGKLAVPTDLMTWGKWLQEAKEERIVAKDERDGVRVSTVFLGLDHNFGEGPPLLFETMIFGGEHDQWQDRYTTWEQAEAGHKAAVAVAWPPPFDRSQA